MPSAQSGGLDRRHSRARRAPPAPPPPAAARRRPRRPGSPAPPRPPRAAGRPPTGSSSLSRPRIRRAAPAASTSAATRGRPAGSGRPARGCGRARSPSAARRPPSPRSRRRRPAPRPAAPAPSPRRSAPASRRSPAARPPTARRAHRGTAGCRDRPACRSRSAGRLRDHAARAGSATSEVAEPPRISTHLARGRADAPPPPRLVRHRDRRRHASCRAPPAGPARGRSALDEALLEPGRPRRDQARPAAAERRAGSAAPPAPAPAVAALARRGIGDDLDGRHHLPRPDPRPVGRVASVITGSSPFSASTAPRSTGEAAPRAKRLTAAGEGRRALEPGPPPSAWRAPRHRPRPRLSSTTSPSKPGHRDLGDARRRQRRRLGRRQHAALLQPGARRAPANAPAPRRRPRESRRATLGAKRISAASRPRAR